MQKERIGIIGLGRMGAAMAARLAIQGFAVTGWTRRGVSDAEAAALRIRPAAHLEALAQQADILILSLMDDQAVDSILGQLEKLDLSGRLVVETSTVSPKILPAHRAALASAGAEAIDAPISGGPDQVRQGSIGLYIGGDAGAVARFMPVAEQLSNRIHHIGPLGHGAAAKLVNNMMLLGLWQTLKEALQLGQAAGLTRETMLGFLETSPATSPALKSRLPIILGESDSVGFSLSGVAKDAGVVMDLANDLNLTLPAMTAARQSFLDAEQAGLGERDLATMVRAATESEGRTQ